MAERYRFFDSIDGEDERFYTADEFAEYFRQFLSSGVYAKDGQAGLRVEADEVSMQVGITQGAAFIEGYMYKIDTEPLTLTLAAADPALNRIDRVVVRLDKTLENRHVKAFVLTGEPSANPSAPQITRDGNIYEISLAKINVTAGKSFVEQSQIIDERTNEDVCGFVSSLISIPTSQFQDEWEDWKTIVQPALIDQFNQWFTGIIDDTGGDIDVFTQAFNAWFGGIKQQYDDWFDGIEDGTFITYEKIDTDRGMNVAVDGKISIKAHLDDGMPHKTIDGGYKYGLRVNEDKSITLVVEEAV